MGLDGVAVGVGHRQAVVAEGNAEQRVGGGVDDPDADPLAGFRGEGLG